MSYEFLDVIKIVQMEINLSLAELFLKTFGYESPAFQPRFEVVAGDTLLYRLNTASLGSDYYAKDANGREIFLPVTLRYNDPPVQTLEGDVKSGTVMKEWVIPNCVVSVTSRKTIIETALTERRGTVKELINIEDYKINIKGFLINANNDFPETDLITLIKVYENNTPLSMQNALTDIFLLRPDRSGSDMVVVKSLSFPEVRGVKNVRAFELECVSDEAFNLIAIS